MPKNDNPQALRFLASMAKHGEQAAGERFAEEHPLGKSADISKRSAWAKALCGYLNDRYDEETVKAIRMDCACGPYAINGKLKALYEKSDGPIPGFRWNMTEPPITSCIPSATVRA